MVDINSTFGPQLLKTKTHRFGKTASPWLKPGIIQKISGIE